MEPTDGSRQSQVQEQIFSAKSDIDRLSATIDKLIDRLTPVMMDVAESPEKVEKLEAKKLVPLAEEIRCIRSAIVKQTDKVEDILRKLEI